MTGLLKGRWWYALPLIFALGGGYFGWAVSGALHKGTPVRAAIFLAVLAGLMAVWLAESSLLGRLLKLPFADVARKIAISWLPLVLLPLSAPYFSHRVASPFLKGNPSTGRVLALAAALVILAALGSVVLKLLIIWRRSDVLVSFLERRAVRLLWAGVAIYFVVFVSLAFLAYARLRGYHSDLGQYNQILWASMRGRIFWSTLDEATPDSFLGTHISPFLLMLLPVYAIKQSPLTYLFLRSLALSLSAIPLFYCLRRITHSGAAALILSGAFLLHPEIVAQHFTSGYEVVFAAVLFFVAFYFFMANRMGWFLFFLIMVLAVREDFVPVALMFSVYGLIKRKPLAWILTPLALFAVWETAVILIFSSVIVHNVYNLYYGGFGSTPGELVKTVIFHPFYLIEEILHLQTSYLYNLLMPLGLVLPFFSAVILFALPNMAIMMLRGQDFSAAAGGISHYSVLVVAALWLGMAQFAAIMQKRSLGAAAADGTSSGIKDEPARGGVAGRGALIVAVVIAVLVAGASHLWSYYLPVSKAADADAVVRAVQMIPPDAAVSSNDGRALIRLSSRWEVYEPLVWDVPQEPDRLPQGIEQLKTEYVLVKPFANPIFNDAGAFAFLTEPGNAYQLLFDESGIKLYKRESAGRI